MKIYPTFAAIPISVSSENYHFWKAFFKEMSNLHWLEMRTNVLIFG